MRILFHLSLIAFLLEASNVKAQVVDTATPSAFVVDSITIISPPIPLVGDTVQMMLRFHSAVTQTATMRLDYPGHIAPPDQDTEIFRDSSISVDSGIEYTYYIPLRLFNYGGSLVSASFSGLGSSPGYENFGYAGLEIESSATSFTVLNHGSNANDFGTSTATGALGNAAHITLIGKVDYFDASQGITRGAYGVTVVLLFHSINNPAYLGIQGCPGSGNLNLTFVHPVAGCDGGYGLTSPGVHWCKCDADGNFSFDFYITDPTWSAYADADLLVTASNDAARLTSDPGDEVSTYTITSASPAPCSSWTTFRQTYSKCIPCNPTSLIYQSGIDIRLNSIDGPILRNMEMAQEFDNLRAGVRPGQIATKISSIGYDYAYFDYSYIAFNSQAFSSAYPDHEFGHYCNWLLCNDNIPGNYDMSEGWAQFHSMVVRWYTAANYGDIIYRAGVTPNDDFEDWTFRQDYASLEGKDKVACFLCNVYDKYSDPGFRDPDYDGKDNDDIGEPLRIFAVTSPSFPYTSISDFKTNVEAAFSSVENASIDDIYQFTLGNRSILMRPAQIANLTGDIVKGDGFNQEVYKVTLSWASQDYSTGNYINAPDGFHVYESTDGGSTWSLNETVSAGSTSTNIDIYSSSRTFKVSAYNSSGDSYDAPTVSVSYNPAGKIAAGTQAPGTDTAGLDVTIHPNPAGNYTRICVADLPADVPAVVEVVNENGDVVATLYNATPDAECGLCLTLDCKKLPSGIYYAHIANAIMGRAVKISVQH